MAGGGGCCVDFAQQSRGKREGKQAARHGRQHFLQQSFRRFDFILQKVFAGRWPKMWWAEFIRGWRQAMGEDVRKADGGSIRYALS